MIVRCAVYTGRFPTESFYLHFFLQYKLETFEFDTQSRSLNLDIHCKQFLIWGAMLISSFQLFLRLQI